MRVTKAQLQKQVEDLRAHAKEIRAAWDKEFYEMWTEQRALKQTKRELEAQLRTEQAKVASLTKDVASIHEHYKKRMDESGRHFELRQRLAEAELRELRKQIQELKAKNLQDCFSQKPRHQSPTLTPDEIQDMILLCHPDVHKNSERSNRVTAKLLQMRGAS